MLAFSLRFAKTGLRCLDLWHGFSQALQWGQLFRGSLRGRTAPASFPISQMSCSSAGPRGPAVRMLVLSATGAPVALMKTFFVYMTSLALSVKRAKKIRASLLNTTGG